MHDLRISAFGALFLCSVSLSASYAKDTAVSTQIHTYKADINRSSINFATTQNGSPVSGSFPITDSVIVFDPHTPENSRTTISVSIKDIILSQPALIESTLSSDWFDAASFPKASFTSESFRSDDKEGYILDGILTVKDVTKPITATVDILNYSAESLHATAHFTFDRTAFGVGWADISAVPADTDITIEIFANAVE